MKAALTETVIANETRDVDPRRVGALLARLQLFRNVDPGTLGETIAHCAFLRLDKDRVLLAPGVRNHSLYLVIAGRLQVHLEAPAHPPISVVEPGECVGEMSLLENQPPSAFVVASEPTQLLKIPEPQFWELLNISPQINRNMLHILSMRLRLGNLLVADSLKTQQAFLRDATIDALTGLHNRRWLDNMFEQELVHSRREGLPLCLLMMDVDRFKDYNDRHGHLAGDRLLAGVSDSLRGALRPTDMLARYGGEEFALLLPQTRLREALDLAERLRKTVAATRVPDGNGGWQPQVTASFGVCVEKGQELPALIAEADAALYRAKRAGRNRVST